MLIPYMIEDFLLILPHAAPHAEPTVPPSIEQSRKFLIPMVAFPRLPTDFESISRDDAAWRKHGRQATDGPCFPTRYGASLLDLLDSEGRRLVTIVPPVPTCRRG